MEYVYKINNFGLKMMVKSGLEKIFMKSIHTQSHFRKICLCISQNSLSESLYVCSIDNSLCFWQTLINFTLSTLKKNSIRKKRVIYQRFRHKHISSVISKWGFLQLPITWDMISLLTELLCLFLCCWFFSILLRLSQKQF